MADFLMPSLGADMESGVLTEWLVKPGDTVKRGDVVASVETAKGIIDIEIFADGVIDTLLVEPGAEVPVGSVLARYRASQADGAAPAAAAAARPATPAPVEQLAPVTTVTAPPSTSRALASPAARRRAAELGIELSTVAPHTGGAVTLADVERTAAVKVGPAVAAATRPTTDMRTLIAHAMSRSKREIPHYYLATTIDMSGAVRWLEGYNRARPVTERLLYSALLVKAVARALERFPELNGFWGDGQFEPAATIDIGMATRLRQGGLVAPALRAVNRQPLPELMRALQDLVQRTRTGGLRSSELADATITISSLGEGSVETVFPIIHPPQVAIIGFGAIVTRPWFNAGAIVAAPVVTATLSADHRASDGHRGSAFLATVADHLQHPEAL